MTIETPPSLDVMRGRRARSRRGYSVTLALAAAVIALAATSLMVGQTFYPLTDVARVIAGLDVAGASFTVGELRLPRTVTAICAGLAFGTAGATFQTMLRNPLASPDVIGISTGASASAVFAIIALGLGAGAVSAFALGGALVTAGTIYLLSYRTGFSGTRLILIGIGIGAMLHSAVLYILSQAPAWNLAGAMQWLSGSLNGVTWTQLAPLVFACAMLLPPLYFSQRELGMLELGDDNATALGVRTSWVRVGFLVFAVALIAFATATTGPIAFVAFMAGPIAARLVSSGQPRIALAGLVGAVLVLASDLIAQFAFESRYPVGVITGVLGAPYLVLLLIRMNRSEGTT